LNLLKIGFQVSNAMSEEFCESATFARRGLAAFFAVRRAFFAFLKRLTLFFGIVLIDLAIELIHQSELPSFTSKSECSLCCCIHFGTADVAKLPLSII
jgi:hypothetical protein